MNFSEYQQEAHKTAICPKIAVWHEPKLPVVDSGYTDMSVIYPVLALCGEAGELAEKIKKCARDKQGKISAEDLNLIMLEMGDVMWYIAEACTQLDVKMEDVANMNIEKLQKRRAKNCIQGSGDLRHYPPLIAYGCISGTSIASHFISDSSFYKSSNDDIRSTFHDKYGSVSC